MYRISALVTLTTWVASSLQAIGAPSNVDQTIVFIECTKPGEPDRHGSGVIVSPQGHIVTAKHVIPTPPGVTCRGSIGVANPGGGIPLVIQPTVTAVDAALLRFAQQQEYQFARICALEDWMVRRKIYVSGFPGGTVTGVPSFREGVLSTVFPSSTGLLETDGQTVAGMSGGPVFSANMAGLIGIVIGAEFSPSGLVSFYGILPASSFAAMFGLNQSQMQCYRPSREVELPAESRNWKAGNAAVRLGVRSDEGICFLASVWGQFNDPGDTVAVVQVDGEFVLQGENLSAGQHGGTARCIWFD